MFTRACLSVYRGSLYDVFSCLALSPMFLLGVSTLVTYYFGGTSVRKGGLCQEVISDRRGISVRRESLSGGVSLPGGSLYQEGMSIRKGVSVRKESLSGGHLCDEWGLSQEGSLTGGGLSGKIPSSTADM